MLIFRSDQSEWAQFKLSQCRKLESVDLHVPLRFWPLSDLAVAGVCTILAGLHGCPALREVVLSFDWIVVHKSLRAVLDCSPVRVTPIENELLRLDPCVGIIIDARHPAILEVERYSSFIDEFRRHYFPSLFERGVLQSRLSV